MNQSNPFRVGNIGVCTALIVMFVRAFYLLVISNFPINPQGGEAIPFMFIMLVFIILALIVCFRILLKSVKSKYDLAYERKLFAVLILILIAYGSLYFY
jgi:CHASE1-domain containing sensor protein